VVVVVGAALVAVVDPVDEPVVPPAPVVLDDACGTLIFCPGTRLKLSSDMPLTSSRASSDTPSFLAMPIG
jgi:hypothetical protein